MAHSSLLRRTGVITASLLLTGTLGAGGASKASTHNGPNARPWNDAASRELAAALHHLHEVANSDDRVELKRLILGDEALTTFELTGNNRTPVTLRSKLEIDAFIEGTVSEAARQDAVWVLEMP